MSTRASFYWPLLPSFPTLDHLQVPPSTWNGPVREELEVATVSLSSGKPFILHSPASPSTTSTPTQSRRSTIVLGQSPSAGSIGLGFKSGTPGIPSLSPSNSLNEALDLWAQEMDACEPFVFRVASDSRGGLGYCDDADSRTPRRHSVHGYGYL
ncbi:hypothetical protein L227DRAFT_570941 [Lentinus tigrinus ALCF2SS1-6]|uniref:Uncharacterized protein n=2 Tax=Lentinus tigrinus TaxID=5365 RepID=A0A5C2SRE1_9APHY|nr:hypothetical protein L227DRAFT_570941 [Lentinus tigrinus ALCF2SS1-6]